MWQSIRWWLFFIFGFYVCAALTVLPIPLSWQWFRPQWVLLFFIFCQIVHPRYFNPIFAWVGGLLVDSLLDTPLGEHALVFSIVCYITSLLRPRFILRPLWQQLGKIFLLVSLGQILILWFHALIGQNPHTLLYWMGTLTSCLCWPILVALCGGVKSSQKVAHLSSRSI